MNDRDWIAVDWGTSHLRVWEMCGAQVLKVHHSDNGMGRLNPDGFAPALYGLVGDSNVPIVACGMVGSKQGWCEAPYLQTPSAPPSIKQAARMDNVYILPGIKHLNPPDVMRGEETQIAGFLAQNPNFNGVLCLPGTHCKWVRILDGQIVSFKTVMTGELFALITEQSLLRHGMDNNWDGTAFHEAVFDTLSYPERLVERLFQIRANNLLNGLGSGCARAQVSGYLIGAELAATKSYWQAKEVVVIGATRLAPCYLAALRAQRVTTRAVDGESLVLDGLIVAKSELVNL